jgi:DNA repair exonuclease SbcCD ATPase subunit
VDIEELRAELSKQTKLVTELSSEKASILSKNQELLSETKKAKKERNELKDQFSDIKAQFDDLKNKSEHGDDVMEKVNELVGKKLESKQAEFESQIDDVTKKAEEFENKYNSVVQKYNGEKISLAVRTAAEKAGVLPTAIDDVVNRASGMFSISEDGKIESRDSEGNLRKVGKKVLDPNLFVENLKESATHFWPASESSGANGNSGGGNSGSNPWLKDSINYTEQARITKENPQKAEKMKAAAGG